MQRKARFKKKKKFNICLKTLETHLIFIIIEKFFFFCKKHCHHHKCTANSAQLIPLRIVEILNFIRKKNNKRNETKFKTDQK